MSVKDLQKPSVSRDSGPETRPVAKQKMRMHAQFEKAWHSASATSFDDLRLFESCSTMASL